MDSEDNKVYMKRLNHHSVDEEKRRNLFPPSNEFYDLIQGENFIESLSINGTTEDGQNTISQNYHVVDKWKSSKHEGDHVDTYYELSLLVKTKSKNDKVWISFIDGLHRHADITASLLCMKFDYSNNIIILGSLQLDDFETAIIPYYKKSWHYSKRAVRSNRWNDFDALMLKTPILIQAYIPNRFANQIGGTIQLLMQALKTQSEWILISKLISANKMISKLLSTW
jgi:hypothetical protein